MGDYKNQSILVTGACGSIGSVIVDKLIQVGFGSLTLIDNNETELFHLQTKLSSLRNVQVFFGDIRDRACIEHRMRGIDIVIHAAALKHVGLCEKSPDQAIHTNILGTQNLIDSALENGVKRFLFTSSDKAVNPTNVMGSTKLLGEKLVSAAAERSVALTDNRCIFSTTRFGNVLGSRGSVLPIFKQQILEKKPITVTHRDMSRFIMSNDEAATLVLNAVWKATGGEVLVTKMPVVYIRDLAIAMNAVMNGQSEIIYIGQKPGEKLYEELVNDEEIRRTYDEGPYLRIAPVREMKPENKRENIKEPYNSKTYTKLDIEQICQYLVESEILKLQ